MNFPFLSLLLASTLVLASCASSSNRTQADAVRELGEQADAIRARAEAKYAEEEKKEAAQKPTPEQQRQRAEAYAAYRASLTPEERIAEDARDERELDRLDRDLQARQDRAAYEERTRALENQKVDVSIQPAPAY